jgi:branched-chain amino acid transport system ATP-binding protein
VVDRGEIVAIIGPNGAGKSTLLKAIAGILKLKMGSITLAGSRIYGRPAREISTLGIAFVPQEHNIFPTMSVAENLEIGGYVDRRGTRGKIAAILERFPMLAQKRRHAARTLSGGQRQILAMAMALMVEPPLLLLGEPSAGLSPIAARRSLRRSPRSTVAASPSPWSSRTRARPSPSPIAAISWWMAGTAAAARRLRWRPIRR